MGVPECIHIAAKMLDVDPHRLDETHPEIYKKLIRMEGYAYQAGGSIRSRQIVAMVIDGLLN